MVELPLEMWEYWIFYAAVFMLIIGLILFFMTIIFSGMHVFDLDSDLDVHGDVDVSGAHDIGGDIHDAHGGDGATPLFLIAGVFLLSFGGFGTIVYWFEAFDPMVRLGVVVGIPLLVTMGTARLWGSISRSTSGEPIPSQTVRINDEVYCITDVDEKGGIVRVSTGTTHKQIKMSARTTGHRIPRGSTAYIVDKVGSMLIIDEWPITGKK